MDFPLPLSPTSATVCAKLKEGKRLYHAVVVLGKRQTRNEAEAGSICMSTEPDTLYPIVWGQT